MTWLNRQEMTPGLKRAGSSIVGQTLLGYIIMPRVRRLRTISRCVLWSSMNRKLRSPFLPPMTTSCCQVRLHVHHSSLEPCLWKRLLPADRAKTTTMSATHYEILWYLNTRFASTLIARQILIVPHQAQQSHVSCGAPAATGRCRPQPKASRWGRAKILALGTCQVGPPDQPSTPQLEARRAPSPCIINSINQ